MRLLVAITLAAACACSGTPTAPSTGQVTISGTVFDYPSRAPLASAMVQVLADTQAPIASATTDTNGRYSATVPAPGEYHVRANGGPIGEVHIFRPGHRGDLLVDAGGNCIGRYGVVLDARTRLPIRGAQVQLANMTDTTTSDGSYAIELGCPGSQTPGGTTLIYVTHPDYQPVQRVVGRGIAFVSRLDISLEEDD
jgi:hypothetical protein